MKHSKDMTALAHALGKQLWKLSPESTVTGIQDKVRSKLGSRTRMGLGQGPSD